jgi:hypothetical protein
MWVLPNITVLAFYASTGVYNYGYGIDILVRSWGDYLTHRAQTDPAWPFQAHVELIDYRSNLTYLDGVMKTRIGTGTTVGAVLAPEGPVGVQYAGYVGRRGIPYILTTSNPSPVNQTLPPDQTTAFYLEAPAMYTFRALIDQYVGVGVRTLATVIYSDAADAGYNYWSCHGTAAYLAVPRGIAYLAEFILYSNSTATEVQGVVAQLRQLDPDAVLWCDWQSCSFDDPDSNARFGLSALKAVDYTPKAVTFLDCYNTAVTDRYVRAGLVDFVTQATFTHPALKGQEYTEDDFPYARRFRPTAGPVAREAVEEAINVGATAASPSSVHLFNAWFLNATGQLPQYQANGYAAALDLLESAIYRVTQNAAMMRKGHLHPADVVAMLTGAQASGMYGRVVFDAHRINTPTPTIGLQLYPGDTSPVIICPSSQSQRPMIYPMPTWSERTYRWSITKGAATFGSAVAVATVCSVLLLAMAVTVVWHRTQTDVRILQYSHMVGMCVASMVAIWSCVFLWQADMTAAQCTAYAWTTYVPMSFVVHLINMKAYRLSVFLHSESRHRLKRLTHTRMLLLALGWTGVTAIVLLIVQLVDPPTLRVQIMDPYRPALNVHTCVRGGTATGLLHLLGAIHLAGSVGSVISVRNGTGEFRDGTVMKEAFTLLWIFWVLAYVMQTFALDVFTLYLLRTVFIGVGLTTFCFRILVNRCYRHWVPKQAEVVSLVLYHHVIRHVPFLDPSRRKSSTSIVSLDTLDGPTYSEDLPDGQKLEEMHEALQDPARAAKFREFAQKSFVAENVDFLQALKKFEQDCGTYVIETSKHVSEYMKIRAEECVNQFIRPGCEYEVNISAATRQKIQARLDAWNHHKSIFTPETAANALDDDPDERINVFDRAGQEISVMLYQNLWNKFHAMELEEMMN